MSLSVLSSETAVKPGVGRADRKADTSDETGGKFNSLLKGEAEDALPKAKGEAVAEEGKAADSRSVWTRYHQLMNKTATGLGEEAVGLSKKEEAEAQPEGETAAEGEETPADIDVAAPTLHDKVSEVAIQSAAVVPTAKAQTVQAERGEEAEAQTAIRIAAKAEADADGDIAQTARQTAQVATGAAIATETRQQPVANQRAESSQQSQNAQQASAATGAISQSAEADGGTDAGERDGDRRNGGREQGAPQPAQAQNANRISGVTVLSQQTAPAPVQGLTQTATALTEQLAQGLSSATRAEAAMGASLQSNAASKPGMVTTLNIQLQPIELGTVTARISGSEGQLSIEITVENAEARQRLTTDSDSIVSALRGMGIEVDRVTVQQSQANSGTQQNSGGREDQFAQSEQGRGEGQSESSGRGNQQQGGASARGQGNEASDPAGGGLYI
jgi:chemotaxis protein MotD